MLDLYFIRHGYCQSNRDECLKILLSDESDTLTEIGKTQAHRCGQHLSKIIRNTAQIYFSPTSRTSETANIISKYITYSVIEDSDLLLKRSYNQQNKKIYNEYYSTHIEKDIIQNKDCEFLLKRFGGESRYDLYKRAVIFINYLQRKHNNSSIIIVSHVGWIRMAIMYILQQSIEEYRVSKYRNISNCEIIKMQL